MRVKLFVFIVFILGYAKFSVSQEVDTQLIYNSQKLAFNLIFTNPDRAQQMSDSLIAKQQRWPDSLKANNYKNKAILFATKNQLDSALYYFNTALGHLDKSHPEYPNMLNNIAVAYKKQNRFKEAVKTIDLGDSIAKAQSNFSALALLAGQRATCYTRLQNFSLAIEFQKKAIDYFKKDEQHFEELIIEEHNLFDLYLQSGNFAIAKEGFEALLPKLKDINRLPTYYLAQLNLSHCEINLGNYRRADSLITLSKSALQRFNNTNFLSYADELKALLYFKQQNYERAKPLYANILDKAFVNNNERLFNLATLYLQTLAKTKDTIQLEAFTQRMLDFSSQTPKSFGVLDQIKFYKQALIQIEPQEENRFKFNTLKQLVSLQDSLHTISKFSLENQLQLAYKNQLAEKDNIILQKKIDDEKKKNYALLLLSVITLFVLLFALTYYRNKRKLSLLEDQKRLKEEKLLKDKLTAEQNLNDFREREIEKQKSEVMALTIERAKTINKFIELTKEFDEQTQEQIADKIAEVTHKDKYWDHIQQKFKRLNPHFVNQLKDLYPGISHSQIDFCAMIKMQLDNKSIAKILNITHESVITKKYRLKKKMGIDKDIDFTSYVESL